MKESTYPATNEGKDCTYLNYAVCNGPHYRSGCEVTNWPYITATITTAMGGFESHPKQQLNNCLGIWCMWLCFVFLEPLS